MSRFDRLLGMLLMLSDGQAASAGELARRFGVSRRTIYRDVEALNALGVPVYAQRGFEGGLRLMEGYFLPPLMFTTGEAISLLLGLTLLNSLAARPYPAELDTAERKLLAGVPQRLRAALARARALVGFDAHADDIFHPEPAMLEEAAAQAPGETGQVVGAFLQATLEGRALRLRYRSPYQPNSRAHTLEPLGLLWDRDRWYLAARRAGQPGSEPRLWRADRVLDLAVGTPLRSEPAAFDVRALLGGSWMRPAMQAWIDEAPVRVRLTAAQASRLQRDWYYRHARYEPLPDGAVLMTLGEDDPAVVFALLRWLGLSAELLEPRAWRAGLRAELLAMAEAYAKDEG